MAKIFVSYSRKDEDRVKILVKSLGELGHSIFFAGSSIPVGEKFQETISNNLKTTDVVISVITRNSVDSKWVMTEIGIALGHWQNFEKPLIIPLILDDVEIPPQLLALQSLVIKDEALDEAAISISLAIENWVNRRKEKENIQEQIQATEKKRSLFQNLSVVIAIVGVSASLVPLLKVLDLNPIKILSPIGAILAALGFFSFSQFFLNRRVDTRSAKSFLGPNFEGKSENSTPSFFYNLNEISKPELEEDEEEKPEIDPLKKMALAKIRYQQNKTISRLKRDLSMISGRATINLGFGIGIAVAGIILLLTLLILNHQNAENYWAYLQNSIPKITMITFVEILAFFFLKQYKENIFLERELRSEITDIQSKYLALKVFSIFSTDVTLEQLSKHFEIKRAEIKESNFKTKVVISKDAIDALLGKSKEK